MGCWGLGWGWREGVFLAGVGCRVEGLVEGDGVCGGLQTMDGSGDGGLRRCGDEGVYAGEREVAWRNCVSDEQWMLR